MNYCVMNKDDIVASVVDDTVTLINPELCPKYIQNKDFSGWLKSRSIDVTRTNARLLKRALQINYATSEEDLVLYVNAACVTDTFWVKPMGSVLHYSDVVFRSNVYDMLALSGNTDIFGTPPQRTPELTNTGSFEKCWRKEDDGWYLCKSGSDSQLFAEMFAYYFCKENGFPTADYSLCEGYVKSKDFTDGARVNFEEVAPYFAGIPNFKDFDETDVFFALSKFCGVDVLKDYLKLIYSDMILINVDRHTMNYGFLRDVETGKILSLAPNYDNNLCLNANNSLKLPSNNDMFINDFLRLLKENLFAKQLFDELNIKPLNIMQIKHIAEQIPINEKKSLIIDVVNARQNLFWNAYKTLEIPINNEQVVKESIDELRF